MKKSSNTNDDKTKETKENNNSLLNSSMESEVNDNKSHLSDESNFDSLTIKFPDKVQMQKIEDPLAMFKLDFTKVHAKYQSSANNMKGKLNASVPAQNNKNKLEKKKPAQKKNEDNDLDLIIDKLKNDMKNSSKTVKDLNCKLDKQKNLNKDLKQKIVKLNENLKMASTKIESLESQIKKIGGDLRNNNSIVKFLYKF